MTCKFNGEKKSNIPIVDYIGVTWHNLVVIRDRCMMRKQFLIIPNNSMFKTRLHGVIMLDIIRVGLLDVKNIPK